MGPPFGVGPPGRASKLARPSAAAHSSRSSVRLRARTPAHLPPWGAAAHAASRWRSSEGSGVASPLSPSVSSRLGMHKGGITISREGTVLPQEEHGPHVSTGVCGVCVCVRRDSHNFQLCNLLVRVVYGLFRHIIRVPGVFFRRRRGRRWRGRRGRGRQWRWQRRWRAGWRGRGRWE